MGFFSVLGLIVVACIIIAIALAIAESAKVAKMSPEQRNRYERKKQEAMLNFQYSDRNAAMVCPHCHEKGHVRTKAVNRKKGISGGKATAAVITGGVSVLATGLSRKESLTQAHCDNCNSTWDF